MDFEDLQDEREYDVELIGNFGRFISSGSYPVEFFMASMPMSQANKYLKFARDVQMDDVNFDLLMQRDIDEKRVEEDIIPYLQQDETTAATRPLFFPPLLAAIVPVSDEKIREFYGARSRVVPRPGFVGESWAGHFMLYGKETSSSDGLALSTEPDSPKIKSKQAILSLRTSELNPHGVMLIVIDGQHRLRALKRLWEEHRDKVRDLVVPVCVMYAPNSHENADKVNIPSVPRVFRNLFVDVNSTMTVVGGHFNILLSDKSLGDIACRVFCDSVLTKYGKEGLACVEWNTRSKKQSFNVNKVHSLTSIGVLQRSLEDNFKADMLVYYLLGLTEGAQDMFPDGADADEYYPRIKWDKFSYAQSNALKLRIKDHLSPLLISLFFESVPFKRLHGIFLDEVGKLKDEVKRGGRSGVCAQAVLQHLLEYKPLDEKDPDYKKRWLQFEEAIESRRSDENLNIVRYALFQRAFFNVAGIFVRFGLEYAVTPANAFAAAIALLNYVFEKDRSVFDFDKSYLQYTAFDQRRIRTREETRFALRDLLLSYLLVKDARDAVYKAGFTSVKSELITPALIDRGFNAAGEFLARYREERAKAFKKGYELDYSLTHEQRDDLRLKELEQRAAERAVKESRVDEGGINKSFDNAVNEYIEAYFVEAKKDLRSSLGVEGDLLEKQTLDESIESEEI
ncbi:hypothetical protein [Pseudomonas sp. Gutcm_11s]|uniref:hypothetical protein n=1 Tax=Pseudomonas sp. Gutcm_11s TaxID=3026088 RepID=UPI00235FFFE4|nr:hypothetical protein [Pseudomonas sp. Gutcm_11s]MDD0841181.1 hypothetical protein [Pseudomonas sp. Gutcm_11s]